MLDMCINGMCQISCFFLSVLGATTVIWMSEILLVHLLQVLFLFFFLQAEADQCVIGIHHTFISEQPSQISHNN